MAQLSTPASAAHGRPGYGGPAATPAQDLLNHAPLGLLGVIGTQPRVTLSQAAVRGGHPALGLHSKLRVAAGGAPPAGREPASRRCHLLSAVV